METWKQGAEESAKWPSNGQRLPILTVTWSITRGPTKRRSRIWYRVCKYLMVIKRLIVKLPWTNEWFGANHLNAWHEHLLWSRWRALRLSATSFEVRGTRFEAECRWYCLARPVSGGYLNAWMVKYIERVENDMSMLVVVFFECFALEDVEDVLGTQFYLNWTLPTRQQIIEPIALAFIDGIGMWDADAKADRLSVWRLLLLQPLPSVALVCQA